MPDISGIQPRVTLYFPVFFRVFFFFFFPLRGDIGRADILLARQFSDIKDDDGFHPHPSFFFFSFSAVPFSPSSLWLCVCLHLHALSTWPQEGAVSSKVLLQSFLTPRAVKKPSRLRFGGGFNQVLANSGSCCGAVASAPRTRWRGCCGHCWKQRLAGVPFL